MDMITRSAQIEKELPHACHKKELARIKRIAGQISGIQKMVEKERYCVDILTQIKAARSALASLETVILEKHMDHCLKEAMDVGNEALIDQKVAELMEIFKKSIR